MKTRRHIQHRERLKNEETTHPEDRSSMGGQTRNPLGVTQGQNGEQGNTTRPRQRKALGKLEH